MASQLHRNTLFVVIGPTAIGKTSLSIQIARHFNTHIISADSRQFFREMSVGTAKPSPEELASAPHHFVDFLSVGEDYSAGQFEREALAKMESLFPKHPQLVMVGGSGMYVNAVCNGLDKLPRSLEIRNELMSRLSKEGLSTLFEELNELDPDYAREVDSQNPQRVIRALEVCLESGNPFSSFRKNQSAERPFNIVKIGLTAEREVVNARIEKRVDQMIKNGLVPEVEALLPFKDLNALKTVGYREIFEFLDQKHSLDEAIENIKKNTRQFAKRQMTWFKKDSDTKWFDISETDQVIPYLDSLLHPTE